MKTLIDIREEKKVESCDDFVSQNEKLINSRFSLDFKFYQKYLLIFLILSTFLIIPESPDLADNLCNKYHTREACRVW